MYSETLPTCHHEFRLNLVEMINDMLGEYGIMNPI